MEVPRFREGVGAGEKQRKRKQLNLSNGLVIEKEKQKANKITKPDVFRRINCYELKQFRSILNIVFFCHSGNVSISFRVLLKKLLPF